MKKLVLSIFIFSSIVVGVFSQNKNQNLYTATEDVETQKQIPINPKTGFPAITKKPFLMFNEGFSFASVTRIEKQSGKSNFGWEDYMIGLYFSMQTGNLKPFDLTLRTAVYYPFYHTFKGQRVYAKQTVLYAFDVFAGPTFQFDFWKYVRLNLTPGLHYMYQLSDEYHLNYLGVGGLVGIELPVTRHCNLLVDGFLSVDYPNLGTNYKVQPFTYAWNYQINIGFRYSLANPNRYSYIQTQKDRLINEGLIEDPVVAKRNQKSQLKKDRAQEKKEIKEQMKYMTKGEKKELMEQVRQEHKAQKEMIKEQKLEQKQKEAEARKIYQQEQKEIKQIKKEAKLKKEAEKKAKQAEHNAKMKELEIRQKAEDEANAKNKAAIEAEKAKIKAEKQKAKAEKSKSKENDKNLLESVTLDKTNS